jgi:hypothetical protein
MRRSNQEALARSLGEPWQLASRPPATNRCRPLSALAEYVATRVLVPRIQRSGHLLPDGLNIKETDIRCIPANRLRPELIGKGEARQSSDYSLFGRRRHRNKSAMCR